MKALGQPCSIPAWALSNLTMAAGCGVALAANSPEMAEARLALGITTELEASGRCKARDLDDPESYRCELPDGHKGPHYNGWAEPDEESNPWERGLDPQRFVEAK